MFCTSLTPRGWNALLPLRPGHVRAFAALAIAAIAIAAASPVGARDTYPSRPITIIVAYPSGSLDALARVLAGSLTKRLGQSVVVENKPGAGSNIAASYVAKSPPDGYTLFLASPATAINVSLYSKLNYDPQKDLVPVSLLTAVPSVLIVSQGSQFKTASELIAYAKQNPGKLNYGSGGAGTSEHLGSEMFKMLTNVDAVHVPYKGAIPAVTDLIGGQHAFMFTSQLTALPLIKGGKVRPLAVADDKRSAYLPDTPHFGEVGYPDLKVLVWSGIMAPAGTPDGVIRRLNAEILGSLEEAEVKNALINNLGANLIGGSPEEFSKFLDHEIAKWRPIVKKSGARVD